MRSPSRGWPTEPGFRSQRPAFRPTSVPLGCEIALETSVDERDRKRDVTVPDEDDRRDRRLEGIARGLLGDHVLPDGISRARVIELGPFGLRRGHETLEVRAVLVEQDGPRPAGADCRVGRELLEVERAEDSEVVIAHEA